MLKGDQWNIIAKRLSNEKLSVEEKAEFEKMIADENVQRIIGQSEKTFEKTGLFLGLDQYNTNSAWEKVDRAMSRRKTMSFRPLLRIAAVFFLLVAGGFAVWKMAVQNKPVPVIAAHYLEGNTQQLLPDGSTVTLNHGSEVKFPKKFTGTTREVTLVGEAFFNIKPDTEKPFIIKTNGASVKVLGTSFNVCAYNESETVEVIVKTGKVELFNTGAGKAEEKVVLMPGQTGTLNMYTRELLRTDNYNPNKLAWYTREISFNYTPLGEVFETLQHAYNIRVDIDNQVDTSQKLTASFSKQDPEYIMDVIALTLDIKVDQTENNGFFVQNN
ncbi:MAG: FecR domain-containing protein [Prolixibacteraceae bacterium]|nr:FecR domain-containing protein [Prolixibacteraceae bacterium]